MIKAKIKKLLYKICNFLGDALNEASFSAVEMSKSVSVPANGSASAVLSFPSSRPNSRYRMLAIADLALNGSGSGHIVIRGFHISNSGGTVTIDLRSLTSSAITVTVVVYGTFVKKVGGVLRNLSIFKAFSDCKPSERMVASC